MTPRQRFAAIRRLERAVWRLAHEHDDRECVVGSPLDDAAHLLWNLRRDLERPGWAAFSTAPRVRP